jgi:predicted GNAT family acetyltransferase
MKIKQNYNGKKGFFFIEEDNHILAKMTYVWAGTNRIIIDHTEVDEKLKGKNAGKQMLAKAVEFARQNNLKIMPLCPFAKSVFDKVVEYQNLLF